MNERETVTLDTRHYEELVRQNNIYQELLCKMNTLEFTIISLQGRIEELTTKGETK